MKFFEKHIIWIILLLSLILRLPFLSGSFWMDEAAQALESARLFSQQLDIIPDFQPPLMHYLVHFAMYLSKEEWWLRTIGALIPGLITIWGTYRVGKLYSNKVGLLAALLLATNSLHIFYSQELRPYSLPAMWAILSWLTLLSNKQKERNKKSIIRNPKFVLLYFITTTLGMYSSYLYPFLVLSQATYVLILNRKIIKQYLLAASCSLLAFLPWLPTFFQQLTVGQSWRLEMPGWENIVSITQLKAIPLVIGKFIYGVMDLEFSWFFILSGLVIVTSISYLIFTHLYSHIVIRNPKNKQLYYYATILLIYFLIPLLTSYAISFIVPVVRPKRLLFLLPSFYLLISYIVTESQSVKVSKLRKPTAYLLLTTILTINAISTVSYYTNPKLQRENWTSLKTKIENKYDPAESIIVFSFNDEFAPWQWYDRDQYTTLATGKLNIDSVENLEQTLKPINDYRYVLVFDYLRDITDPEDQLLTTIESFGYNEVDTIDQVNIGFVRVFARPNSLLSSLKN